MESVCVYKKKHKSAVRLTEDFSYLGRTVVVSVRCSGRFTLHFSLKAYRPYVGNILKINHPDGFQTIQNLYMATIFYTCLDGKFYNFIIKIITYCLT